MKSFDPTIRPSYHVLTNSCARALALSAVLLVGASASIAAPLQDDAPPPEPVETTDAGTESASAPAANATTDQIHQFEMVLHYILIGDSAMVQSSLTSLFDSGITDEQLANLVEERGLADKTERAISRGRGMDDANAAVSELESRYLAGIRGTSRNAHRIEESVVALAGSMRQEMIARTRLLKSGAFAVHALLNALEDGNNPKLANAARVTLVDLSRLSVAPLCAALPDLAPMTQRKVCDILAEIGYPSSLPYLLALAKHEGTTADVRAAALRAYGRLGGTSEDPASQFTALARRYFDQAPSLVPYPRDPENPIWRFEAGGGLTAASVPTDEYCETMAIQTSAQALSLDPSSDLALTIYVAADLRRSLVRVQKGVEVASDGSYSAQFFATASGAKISQQVLGLAIDSSDVQLVRACLQVLGGNAGASALVDSASGRSPVMECLVFGDRRVRFDAALLLARSLPSEPFSQSPLVVPVLASMVQASGMLGAVIASTEEDRQALSTRINALGVSAVVSGASLGEVIQKLQPGQVIDLVIIQGSHDSVAQSMTAIRTTTASATAPVVVIASGSDAETFSTEFAGDSRVCVFAALATEAQFARAIESAVGAAHGVGMDTEESALYRERSLAVLRQLAESSNSAFTVSDAQPVLIDALRTLEGAERISVSNVLALLPGETAQRALMDAALSATEDDRAGLLSSVAASARKYGNLLQQNQIQSLHMLIKGSSGEIAEAAARAFGALELPTSEVVKLILAPKQ